MGVLTRQHQHERVSHRPYPTPADSCDELREPTSFIFGRYEFRRYFVPFGTLQRH